MFNVGTNNAPYLEGLATSQAPRKKISTRKVLTTMASTPKHALYVEVEAKPGKEREVADFLKGAQAIVENEPGTLTWYAIQIEPNKFAIFDTFADDAGRQAHLNGDVAKALMARADELFTEAPKIDQPDVLASKSS